MANMNLSNGMLLEKTLIFIDYLLMKNGITKSRFLALSRAHSHARYVSITSGCISNKSASSNRWLISVKVVYFIGQ